MIEFNCPHCGQAHPESTRFCPVTGETLAVPPHIVCKSCGNKLPGNLKFCPQCGFPIQTDREGNFPLAHVLLMALGIVMMIFGGYFIWRNIYPRIETAFSRMRSEEVENLKEVGRVEEDDISIVTYSPDGRWLGIATINEVTLYEVQPFSRIRILNAGGRVTSMAFSPNGQVLAVGLEDGRVHLWHMPDGVMLLTLNWQTYPVLQLAFSGDGEMLVFATNLGLLYLCQAEDGRVIRTIETISVDVLCVAVSPDGNLLASCAPESVQLWRADTGKLMHALPIPNKPSYLVFSPDSNSLAASTSAGIYHWSVDGVLFQTYGDSSGDSLVFSPNGLFIICGCNGRLEIWEIRNARLAQVFEIGNLSLPTVAFSPENELMVSSLVDGGIRSWIAGVYPDAIAVASKPSNSVANINRQDPTSTRVSIPTNTALPTTVPSPTKIVPTNTLLPTFTPLPTNTPLPINEPIALEINPKDGAEIVIIPAGEFIMGSNSGSDKYFWGAEGPQHEVYLDEYWIYRTEVTNAMYAACVEDQACPRVVQTYSVDAEEYYGNPAYDDYPVIYVSYNHAISYCRWAGGRLPIEAEWEKAARGTDAHLFPWGNNDPMSELVNLCDSGCARGAEREPSIKDGFAGTAPVGSFPAGASPYGALDMAGNVWEWVFDWFQAAYYNVSPYENPRGPASGSTRVIRGGGWNNPNSGERTVARTSLTPTKSLDTLGIRCVIDQP